MLNKDNYAPWSSRIIQYARSRPNGKMIVDSIKNGPYVRRMIATLGEPDLPILVPESFHEQTNEELTENDIKRMDADDQAIQTLLLGLPEDVYAAVDSCETAKEIWELRQTKNLHEADFTQIYDFLKMNENEVNELRAEHLAKSHDPLALMTHSQNLYEFPATHDDQSSSTTYSQQSFPINNKYNPQPSLNQNFMQPPMTSLEDINDPTEAMNATLILFAKAFQLTAPTNNNQRTSSNPRSRQIAQPIMNISQDRQTQNVGGNGGNRFGQYAGQVAQNQQGYNTWQNGIANQNRTGNVIAARAEGTRNGNQARCYNCRGLGHIARNYTTRPRRRDAAYLQTQLLIAQKEEAGIQLQAENLTSWLLQLDKALVYDTDGLAEKLESKIVELEFQVVNYEREISHLKTTYKNLFDFISSNRAHAKLHDLIYKNAQLRAWVFENTFESMKNTSGTSVTPHVDKPKLSAVTPHSKKLHASIPSHSVPQPREFNVVKHKNMIAPGMFKINPSQTPRVDLAPNKQSSASSRTSPITNSQRHVIIKENVSSNTVTASSTTKDETPEVIKNFLKKISVCLYAPVIMVRTDNETEFKNHVLKEYFDSVGITHETYSTKTPQQNGVIEHKDRTLVETARTMLIFSHALLFLWAEAIATACYTQNHSIIHRRFNKTPYELIQGRKPNISYLYVFGALCYLKNDHEDIGKLGAKGNIGFFIGYSANSVAYRVYNRRTKKIIETMNITFDELSAMAFEQNSSRLGLQTPRTIPAAPVLQNLQAPTASMSFQDSAPAPTNSTNTPVSSHKVDEPSQQHAQQQRNLTPSPTASAADNVLNAVFEGYLFVNPFSTPSTESVVSSTQYSVKEALIDPAWIESMQEELHQFIKLDVWELVPSPNGDGLDFSQIKVS
nr:retrovirus-related Pol polyprotein from transposon TNT 1-94 [Tanacetum cinerariifolium]